MRNFNRNIIVLSIAICFAAIGFVGGNRATAQTKKNVKAKPTPNSKKSPAKTAATKATAKAPAKSSEKAATKISAKTASKSPAASTKIEPKKTDKSKTASKVKTPPEKTKSTTTAKTAIKSKEKTAALKPTVKSVTTAKTSTKSVQKPNTTAKTSPEKPVAVKKTPNTKPKDSTEIIVSATSARVRSAPEGSADLISTADIGKVLRVSEENPTWYKVELANDRSGWISKTVAAPFDDAKRGEIYQKIIAKYFKNTKLDFATAAQLADFLKTGASQVKKNDVKADLSFKHLVALSAALKAVPFNKGGQKPYKDFLDANEKEVVFSEPSAEWYVRQNIIWELHAQYKDLPIGEEIAWQAARTRLPGECEGYVNCYLYLLRVTEGEYLNFYPGGKYSKKSLQNITAVLDPIVADLKDKKVYTAATDISDRAEFNRLLTELRTIISKAPHVEKAKTIQQINRIGEGFR